MQTVLEANIGNVEISCPWCIHKYPFTTELIVSQEMIPEMFYKVKSAYERILFLQAYDSQRVGEITRLEQQLIRDRRVFAARQASAKPKETCRGYPDAAPTCRCPDGVERCPG
jgi:hypothetical protein